MRRARLRLRPGARRDLRAVCDDVLREFPFQPRVRAFLGSDGAAVRRLILARLAGDERYESLYEYLMKGEAEWLKTPRGAHGHYPRVFREVYQRLKSIPPLENPVPD